MQDVSAEDLKSLAWVIQFYFNWPENEMIRVNSTVHKVEKKDNAKYTKPMDSG